ncbi:acyltransferase [Leucobacter sp. NPDC058333]|uniref:acyltransferase n=1 Tax=Leucobacter sp. NPDC058333 TaxID=3346450 RepID=UPI003665CE13
MGSAANAEVSSPQRAGGRVEYFDVLRCVAIVAVVMIHVAITEWHEISVDASRWEALTWVNSALRFSVPIFFMISGALFLDPDRPVSVGSLLRKRIPRLAIAYLTWSLIYAALTVYGPGGSGDPLEFISATVTGHFHLWFLLALIGLNLATPILRLVTAERRVAWYFVALAVPFATVFPLLVAVPFAGEMLGTVLGTMRFDLVLGYSGYFVLGYLLHTMRLSRRALVAWTFAAIAGVVVTFIGTSAVSRAAGHTDERFFDFTTLNVAVVAVAVFALAKSWGDAHRLSDRWRRVIEIVGGASFGIYLVHPLFLWALRQFGITTEIAPLWVTVPALTVITCLLSLGASWMLRRSPRVRGVLA